MALSLYQRIADLAEHFEVFIYQRVQSQGDVLRLERDTKLAEMESCYNEQIATIEENHGKLEKELAELRDRVRTLERLREEDRIRTTSSDIPLSSDV